MAKPRTYVEARDHAHWDAVEEAAELIEERLFPAALLNLKAVIEKDAQNPYAYHLLGGLFHEIGELQASHDAYAAAVRTSPDHLGARVALSHVLRELGQLDDAEREAKNALRRHPRDGEAMHALGLVQIERGNAREARKNLQGFLDAKPELEAADEVRTILASLGLDGENDNDD
jgi:Tfp pilus assembly protein PilF